MTNSIDAGRLRSIVERIERLDVERKTLAADIKDIYLEAKSGGFNQKALRALIAERRKDETAAEMLESMVEVYRRALGDYSSTELGVAAVTGATKEAARDFVRKTRTRGLNATIAAELGIAAISADAA